MYVLRRVTITSSFNVISEFYPLPLCIPYRISTWTFHNRKITNAKSLREMFRVLSRKQISIHLHPADVASPAVYEDENKVNEK